MLSPGGYREFYHVILRAPSVGGQAGSMDEFRVAKVARSGNWLWAEYMNVASNGVFNTYEMATRWSSGIGVSFR